MGEHKLCRSEQKKSEEEESWWEPHCMSLEGGAKGVTCADSDHMCGLSPGRKGRLSPVYRWGRWSSGRWGHAVHIGIGGMTKTLGCQVHSAAFPLGWFLCCSMWNGGLWEEEKCQVRERVFSRTFLVVLPWLQYGHSLVGSNGLRRWFVNDYRTALESGKLLLQKYFAAPVLFSHSGKASVFVWNNFKLKCGCV